MQWHGGTTYRDSYPQRRGQRFETIVPACRYAVGPPTIPSVSPKGQSVVHPVRISSGCHCFQRRSIVCRQIVISYKLPLWWERRGRNSSPKGVPPRMGPSPLSPPNTLSARTPKRYCGAPILLVRLVLVGMVAGCRRASKARYPVFGRRDTILPQHGLAKALSILALAWPRPELKERR